jgi:hypothetical protein
MSAYILIAVVVVLGAGLAVWGYIRKEAIESPLREPPAEIYLGLREKILSTSPGELNLSTLESPPAAYGVVMDLGMGSGTATIVSLSTGDTSMYTSRGGGIIGGIGHESCRTASKNFISAAQSFVPKLSRASDHSLPREGAARFYVLTTGGLLVGEATIEALDRGQSPLSPLFAAGNEVITQIRLTAPGYPDAPK